MTDASTTSLNICLTFGLSGCEYTRISRDLNLYDYNIKLRNTIDHIISYFRFSSQEEAFAMILK